LMMEMKAKKEMPHKCESENTFALLLKKIKRFHAFLLAALGATFIYFLQTSITEIIKGPKPEGPTSPNQYVLPGRLPAVLAAWIVWTWWAWIPREKESLTQLEKTTHTTSSTSHRAPGSTPSTHFRSPSKPFPSPQTNSELGDERGVTLSVIADASVVIAAGGSNTEDGEANSLPKFEETRQRPHDNNGKEEEEERLLSSSISLAASSHRVSPLQSSSTEVGMDHIELSPLSSSHPTDTSRLDTDPKIEPTEEPRPSKAVASRRIFNPYLPDAPISEGEDENAEL